MTIEEAQAGRNTSLSLLKNLSGVVANFKIFFKELEDFKNDVVADPQRKAELEAYFTNCECTMTWNELVTAYVKFKKIHDAVEEEQ